MHARMHILWRTSNCKLALYHPLGVNVRPYTVQSHRLRTVCSALLQQLSHSCKSIELHEGQCAERYFDEEGFLTVCIIMQERSKLITAWLLAMGLTYQACDLVMIN